MRTERLSSKIHWSYEHEMRHMVEASRGSVCDDDLTTLARFGYPDLRRRDGQPVRYVSVFWDKPGRPYPWWQSPDQSRSFSFKRRRHEN